VGGNESLPVRELIQNSLDACRYKAYIKPGPVSYSPQVEVIVNYEEKSILVKDNGIWSGHLLSISFDNKTGAQPWYNFGRHIMYVDTNHELIKYILGLHSQGMLWECGELLVLMSSNDESSLKELYERTKIHPFYS
jgi:hypothetical protein